MPKSKRAPRAAALPFLLIHVAVAVVTMRDIERRPARLVRGPKGIWRIASGINTVGAIAYWVVGRRRTTD